MEIIKEAGLVNSLLAPVRMRGTIGPVQMEADAADLEYVARTRAEILDRSGVLDANSISDRQNNVMRNFQNKLVKNEVLPDELFKEIQRDKQMRSKAASAYILNNMSSNPGLIKTVANFENPFSENMQLNQEAEKRQYVKRDLQDEFMERVMKEDEERNIMKIRNAKDKMDAMNKIMVENPNMTREQYSSVLSSLM